MQRYTYLLPLSFLFNFVFPVISSLSSEKLLIILQVRVFNMSRLSGRRPREISMEPAAVYQCHSRRVKKLAVSYHADGPLFCTWNSRAWWNLHLVLTRFWKISWMNCFWKTCSYSLEQLTSCIALYVFSVYMFKRWCVVFFVLLFETCSAHLCTYFLYFMSLHMVLSLIFFVAICRLKSATLM